MRGFLVAVTLVATAGASFAQTPPPQPPRQEQPQPQPPPPDDVDEPMPDPDPEPRPEQPRPPPMRLPDPWALYHQAFVNLAEGDPAQAKNVLYRIVANYPGHPAAAEAQLRIADLDRAVAVDTGPIDPLRDEEPTNLARAELMFFQTVNGAAIGIELCIAFKCDDERAAAATLILGAAAGFGLSWFLTREHGITPGHTHVLDSGAVWGLYHGIAFSEMADPDDESEITTYFALGQVLGTAVGELIYRGFEPTSGQVATANSAGFWSGILGLLVHGVADIEPDIETMVAISDGGLLAGALASRSYPMSRGRTYLIDAAGIVGFLAGALFATQMEDDQSIFGALLVGTGAGLVSGVYLTRNWDD